MKLLLPAVSLFIYGTFAACATSDLKPLALDAQELQASLRSKDLAGANHGVPHGVRENPHFSTDPVVVASIAKYASQGQLGGEGIRAALYALYSSDHELGFYGLEATSKKEADRLDGILREIWAANVRVDRVRVHRGGQVFIVVWSDGVSPACWEAVNEDLIERLATH